MGDFVSTASSSCPLVYSIVGAIWEKSTASYWKALLMVERCGDISERMYTVPMNFTSFTFVNRPREVASPYSIFVLCSLEVVCQSFRAKSFAGFLVKNFRLVLGVKCVMSFAQQAIKAFAFHIHRPPHLSSNTEWKGSFLQPAVLKFVALFWKLFCSILAHTAAIPFLTEIPLMVLGMKQVVCTFYGMMRESTHIVASFLTGSFISCFWRILSCTGRLTMTRTRSLCRQLHVFLNFVTNNVEITIICWVLHWNKTILHF